MASIFDKRRLRPKQIVTVAERRFQDAKALCETNKNAHANGAQYLAGFVIEMLLKAQLIRKYPHVAKLNASATMSEQERRVWSLIYRSHELEDILDELPHVRAGLLKHAQRSDVPYLRYLLEICGAWTIFARYSPQTATMDEANEFLERVRLLKEVLK
jgi:hypothetical protein